MTLLAFTPFTSEHLIPCAIGALITIGILWWGRRNELSQRITTALLVFFNLSAYAYSQVAWLSLDGPIALDNSIPLHLCDLSAFIAGFALITRKPLLCTLTFCWGLAATAQALITPALGEGFPSLPYFTFFLHHFSIVAAALYLPIVLGWRPQSPRWRTPLIALGCGIIYQIFSLIINAILDTNFGFTMHKPSNPSLLDQLGPWPWYLMAMWPMAFLLFFLLCLPFRSTQRPIQRSTQKPARLPTD